MSAYYHGGIPGLKVGDFVLPPSETGVPSNADYGAGEVCEKGKVYLTTDINAAKMFAAFYPLGDGWVYQVEPDGDLEPDKDCLDDGLSWQCKRAKVMNGAPVSKYELNLIRMALMA